jgi:hypothetical protein
MLKMRHKLTDRTGPQRVGGILAAPGWCHIVRFIHNQQIKAAGVGRLTLAGQQFTHEAERALTLEKINRGNQPGIVAPGIDMQPACAAQLPHQRAIDDSEAQTKLVAHLIAPLDL